MLYRKIKYIGTDVSVITLGGNIFGYLANQEKTKQIINKAGDSGINFLDTSDTYSKGISENSKTLTTSALVLEKRSKKKNNIL